MASALLKLYILSSRLAGIVVKNNCSSSESQCRLVHIKGARQWRGEINIGVNSRRGRMPHRRLRESPAEAEVFRFGSADVGRRYERAASGSFVSTRNRETARGGSARAGAPARKYHIRAQLTERQCREMAWRRTAINQKSISAENARNVILSRGACL